MTRIYDLLPPSVVARTGWTLIHFLWQGAAVALVLGIALVWLRRRSANARYLVCCAAMAAFAACPPATFMWLAGRPVPPAQTGVTAPLASVTTARLQPVQPASAVSATEPIGQPVAAGAQPEAISAQDSAPSAPPLRDTMLAALEAHMPWVVTGWFVGVFLFSLHLLVGLVRVRRLRRSGTPSRYDRWQEVVERLSRRLGVSRPVRLFDSALAQAPVVIGWLRPMMLLPASALTGLTAGQLEAILAHELAHIRRHDYLVNLFQTVVETVLFYHPAVHWVSRRMRVEREHCCDDMAVAVCGDSLSYAKALVEMEKLLSEPVAVAMAAGGGSLENRVRRIVGLRDQTDAASSRWLVGAAVVAAMLLVIVPIAWSANGAARPDQSAAVTLESTSPTPAAEAEVKVTSTSQTFATEAGQVTMESMSPAPGTEAGQPSVTPASSQAAAPGRTVRVMGTVLDQSGKPAIGVDVAAYGGTDAADPGPDLPAVATKTGAGGWFALDLPAESAYNISWLIIATWEVPGKIVIEYEKDRTVSRPVPESHQLGYANVRTAGGQVVDNNYAPSRKPVSIRMLIANSEIAGTVVDATGRLVPGAEVRALSVQSRDGTGFYLRLDGHPGAVARYSARTDANGGFKMAQLPDGFGVHVRLDAKGFGRAYEDYIVGGDEKTVIMQPEGRIRGKVIANDHGIDVANVTVQADTSTSGNFRFASDPAQYRTLNPTVDRMTGLSGTDGVFQIDGLAEGDYDLWTSWSKGDLWTYASIVKVHVTAGETAEASIDLVKTVAVSGRVVERGAGNAVAGILMWAYSTTKWPDRGCETDAQGRYSMRLGPGDYKLSSAPGEFAPYGPPNRNIKVASGKDLEVPDIELTRGTP